MSKELELYKAFIDGLVERKDSMTALWVKGDGFPKTEDNKAKNELLAALTPEQKGVLAEMLQDEHIAGIHDTLASVSYTHLYPVYFGYDAKGEICAVYVRFIDIEASYKEQA